MSDAAEPPAGPPQLPRAITDRLRDIRLHRDTLLYAMGTFGEGFPRERFIAAATGSDPAERARVLAVERAFEILMNYVTELTVAGLVAAGQRDATEETSAPREFRQLRDARGISADLCRRLIALQRTRNDLQHQYPTVQAHLLHAAVNEFQIAFASFMRTYPGWLREHVVGAGRS